MTDAPSHIYEDIAARTGGSLYLGVVGPVRTGKSTFVKRFMELLVIPNIENIYQRERAKDELPQSGSGRMIMTSEPKFVPEDAVEITPIPNTSLKIRMIDSVGYMIPGALGAEEDGTPRMVTTPWYPDAIPMTQAAELGTQKVMEEHCSMGVVVTTDGSIHDIPREDFLEAERRAIIDMKATGKPFLVLVNSTKPDGEAALALCANIQKEHQVSCLCVDCLSMGQAEIQMILTRLLYSFPVMEIAVYLPDWLSALPEEHSLRQSLYEALRQTGTHMSTLSQAEQTILQLQAMDEVESVALQQTRAGEGVISCELRLPIGLFYQVLEEQSGFSISSNGELLTLLSSLSEVKRSYDKISSALDQVYATGYGIVLPTPEEMHLEQPQIVRKGSNFGVRLKASAPSIHMLRADIETEINPMVGDEKQSEDLLQYLLQEYEGDTQRLWQSNIFGKSVYELVNEGLGGKLKRMPDEAREKLRNTLSRIINEGSTGLLCIILS